MKNLLNILNIYWICIEYIKKYIKKYLKILQNSIKQKHKK